MTDVEMMGRVLSIVDSGMTQDEALRQNPDFPCPPEILEKQRLIQVSYFSFDGLLHSGQIVLHQDLVSDAEGLFDLITETRFPLTSVIPVSDERFSWSDEISMGQDNTSGFNYRVNQGNRERLSPHASGMAIDIGPRVNPYILKDGSVIPEGATYDLSRPGTLTSDSLVVKFLQGKGWIWEGDPYRDFHHFTKKI